MLREPRNRRAEMDRRRMMMMAGFGALAAVSSVPDADAAPATASGSYLFHDEFDGPAGSAPDPSKWAVSSNRTPIKNPTGFDRPEFFGQYRDSRQNVFVDGKSNLVLRATRDANGYFGALISSSWRGGIGTTWEARIKLNCLTGGCWPAWWLSNDDPGRSGEVDLMEWYGNGEWPSGTTVHANPAGTAFKTHPIAVDGGWHTWRVTWNRDGMYFWEDYVDGAQPYFSVPATGIDDLNDPVRMWPFNNVGYTMFPVLNLAVGGAGGGDPASGSYPAEMLVDWVRVF
ncbi:MAG TPA: glycoside hydrolase family 16 protein [Mycobacterium sp.]